MCICGYGSENHTSLPYPVQSVDHVVPCQSLYLTLVKDVGTFTAQVSNLGLITNQLIIRHVVDMKIY